MILLTGFEPFGGAAFNPSMAIAEGAAAKLRASGVHAVAAPAAVRLCAGAGGAE